MTGTSSSSPAWPAESYEPKNRQRKASSALQSRYWSTKHKQKIEAKRCYPFLHGIHCCNVCLENHTTWCEFHKKSSWQLFGPSHLPLVAEGSCHPPCELAKQVMCHMDVWSVSMCANMPRLAVQIQKTQTALKKNQSPNTFFLKTKWHGYSQSNDAFAWNGITVS